MIALVILGLTAIGCGFAALRIWDYPEWPKQVLTAVAVLNVLAALAVVWRRAWGRRLTLVLLGIQGVGVVAILVVAAAVLIRDNPENLQGSITLIVFLFVPLAVAALVVSLLAARSINRLDWPDR